MVPCDHEKMVPCLAELICASWYTSAFPAHRPSPAPPRPAPPRPAPPRRACGIGRQSKALSFSTAFRIESDGRQSKAPTASFWDRRLGQFNIYSHRPAEQGADGVVWDAVALRQARLLPRRRARHVPRSHTRARNTHHARNPLAPTALCRRLTAAPPTTPQRATCAGARCHAWR